MFKSPGNVLSDAANQSVIGLKLFAGWFHAAVAFAYPVCLSLWRDYTNKKLGNHHIKTQAEVAKLWSTTNGKARIRDICTDGFALEMAFFLRVRFPVLTKVR